MSDLRRAKSRQVGRPISGWVSQVPRTAVFLSAITILELETGVLLMERRDPVQGLALRDWFDGQVLPAFRDRILPVDAIVALRCAALHVPDRRPDRDAYIAATALVHGLTVVTRNVADFLPTGVHVVNPWTN